MNLRVEEVIRLLWFYHEYMCHCHTTDIYDLKSIEGGLVLFIYPTARQVCTCYWTFDGPYLGAHQGAVRAVVVSAHIFKPIPLQPTHSHFFIALRGVGVLPFNHFSPFSFSIISCSTWKKGFDSSQFLDNSNVTWNFILVWRFIRNGPTNIINAMCFKVLSKHVEFKFFW